MKYFLLAIINAGIVATSYSQESTPGCGFIKTGHFVYLDSASNTTWTIKRTSSHQTEENQKTGVIVKHRIKWISACEYKLTQTWANSKELRKANYSRGIYRITSISGNTYYYNCTCNDGKMAIGSVVKIKS